MKPKPLKNKAFELDPNAKGEEGSAFWFTDVKSAVQGLEQDIERDRRITHRAHLEESKEIDALIHKMFDKIYDEFHRMVEKWFPDVVENETQGNNG